MFDPEKVKIYDFSYNPNTDSWRLTRNQVAVDGGKYVLLSEYNQLLETYREIKWVYDDLCK